ncbi:hypothetical protein [Caenispirillum bisanense]|uniref:Uncharacterized protein n=1 Tax=Caenispirillum bisanense TaxID=414052 RepID=A0A286GZ61_9PROT|nr:hypothetical protein [Caenispirillum bisanense]SOE00496.1 hypothetical protein SAMN05421508_1134 [Caenispirillum bisanense]
MATAAGSYDFYVRHLRFMARTAAHGDTVVAVMMDQLNRVADGIAAGRGSYVVPAKRLRVTARALAGLAGFLQQQILPEVVAAGNAVGERQVRWVIDTSMETVAALMIHAETTGDGEDCPVTLPPPPEATP